MNIPLDDPALFKKPFDFCGSNVPQNLWLLHPPIQQQPLPQSHNGRSHPKLIELLLPYIGVW